jgi:hypothetical protein
MDNDLALHRYKTSFDISQLPVKLYALQITYKLYRYDKFNEKLLPDYKMFYARNYEEFEKSLTRRVKENDRLGGIRVDGLYALYNSYHKKAMITKASQVNLEYYTPILFSIRDENDKRDDIHALSYENTQKIIAELKAFIKDIESKIQKDEH